MKNLIKEFYLNTQKTNYCQSQDKLFGLKPLLKIQVNTIFKPYR